MTDNTLALEDRMPRDNIVLGLRGYKIDKVSGGNPVELAVRYMGEVRCPHCASEDLRTKDRFVRKLRHQSFGMRSCVMYLEGRKYQCRGCGRYFNPPISQLGIGG